MNARNKFQIKLKQINELRSLDTKIREDYTNGKGAKQLFELRKKAWIEKVGTKPPTDELKLISKMGQKEADVYAGPVLEKVNNLLKRIDDRLVKLKNELNIIADECEVHSGETKLQFAEVSGWLYSSQGWGANTYAKNSAETYCDIANHYGIETKIEHTDMKGTDWISYTVMVFVESELDVSILKHKKGPSLKEVVSNCYKRGVNPRVYYPFLPYNFEKNNNI